MANTEHPTLGHGKICYIEMPAIDVNASAEFYKNTFGWTIRTRGDGAVAFDDGVMEVSGTFIEGLPPHNGEGLTIHIMIDDMDSILEKITANGGVITVGVGAHPGELTAKFRDPAGNIMSVYQHRG
ncbi:hypothetical protein SAMN05428949_5649 [Chitinophaga sp. YR627]|uniref:VOC family protein n=1 Tax=Chitinophaga sp. YR627 TaxID=1881041 RepID=UPI0008EFABE7|nr:VOC family protein [Chitinophaga sp. YR627]SFO53945.1 hypothetical protein SAMN05428949_5649 [Chitinophaga sp. YR627]